jgi:hypothetical protein
MIVNMIARRRHHDDINDKSPVLLIIICKESDIAEYDTQNISVGKSWQYLRHCCKYPVINYDSDCDINLYQNLHSQTQWMYYASNSPIWNMRFQKYGIKMDHLLKEVVFPSDDVFETFMDKFGFEPDEQCLHIQRACLGID